MTQNELDLRERIEGAMPALRQEMTCVLDFLVRHSLDPEKQRTTELHIAGLRAMIDFASICLDGGDVPSLLRAARDRAEMIANENYTGVQEDKIPGSNIR